MPLHEDSLHQQGERRVSEVDNRLPEAHVHVVVLGQHHEEVESPADTPELQLPDEGLLRVFHRDANHKDRRTFIGGRPMGRPEALELGRKSEGRGLTRCAAGICLVCLRVVGLSGTSLSTASPRLCGCQVGVHVHSGLGLRVAREKRQAHRHELRCIDTSERGGDTARPHRGVIGARLCALPAGLPATLAADDMGVEALIRAGFSLCRFVIGSHLAARRLRWKRRNVAGACGRRLRGFRRGLLSSWDVLWARGRRPRNRRCGFRSNRVVAWACARRRIKYGHGLRHVWVGRWACGQRPRGYRPGFRNNRIVPWACGCRAGLRSI
mmetsp:Transcript_56370/g.157060  ORF Transcript_56370/g.157060 Transcript_56370/m.157060 type:complete len:324 (+) Transcript_56370:940-1911(+)